MYELFVLCDGGEYTTRLSVYNSIHFYSRAGGFKSFQESFPELCEVEDDDPSMATLTGLQSLQISCSPSADTDHLVATKNAPTDDPSPGVVFPVEVLPCLYLGNASNAADMDCLNRNGISYILNVTQDVPNAFDGQDGFRYMQIPIDDHWSQNLALFFPDAIAFIC
jgi:dual specificity MAP kinase phosphatase